MADTVIALCPGIGFVKDLQELVTGVNLLTGERLDATDRLIAGVGVVTAGIGSKVGHISEEMRQVTRIVEPRAAERMPNVLLKAMDSVTVRTAEDVNWELKALGYSSPPLWVVNTRSAAW